MTITSAESFSKREWDRKLKLIILENNLKDTYSKLMEDSTKMDLQ